MSESGSNIFNLFTVIIIHLYYMDNNRPLNEEFYKKLNETNGFLKHMYDNTTFADNYGSSMVIVIIVSLFVFTVFCYCYFMIYLPINPL